MKNPKFSETIVYTDCFSIFSDSNVVFRIWSKPNNTFAYLQVLKNKICKSFKIVFLLCCLILLKFIILQKDLEN